MARADVGKAASGRHKPWRDALRIAVNRDDPSDPKRKILAALAEATVTAALGGDIQAVKEIADRLDGKPKQPVVGDDEDDPITVRTIITGVPRAGDR
jgi:hypothetical protein